MEEICYVKSVDKKGKVCKCFQNLCHSGWNVQISHSFTHSLPHLLWHSFTYHKHSLPHHAHPLTHTHPHPRPPLIHHSLTHSHTHPPLSLSCYYTRSPTTHSPTIHSCSSTHSHSSTTLTLSPAITLIHRLLTHPVILPTHPLPTHSPVTTPFHPHLNHQFNHLFTFSLTHSQNTHQFTFTHLLKYSFTQVIIQFPNFQYSTSI